VREAVLTNLWLTALNQLQPTYVRCPEGKPSWLPDCLLDQGRNVAEYLAVLPSRDARVIASARSGKLCVLDGWTRRLTVPAGACTHACIAARLRVIPWKLACTACCTARVQSSGRVSLSGLWPKAELGSTHGIGLGVFYSVSRMER
jgi:hypothetical protein